MIVFSSWISFSLDDGFVAKTFLDGLFRPRWCCRRRIDAFLNNYSETVYPVDCRLLKHKQTPVNIYIPSKSFGIYSRLVVKGNAEGVNGLGVMYIKGLGATEGDQQALAYNLLLLWKRLHGFFKKYSCESLY